MIMICVHVGPKKQIYMTHVLFECKHSDKFINSIVIIYKLSLNEHITSDDNQDQLTGLVQEDTACTRLD